ncbi:MAG: hypothetical protein A2Y34_13105 [Spirochaetes bacterium GWC1_27_15]|nr:MAG: hypothetical protein A2Z98_14660 [Spirochaetes bacterium GWB1_27_13]OHD25718.1 MAG: hypothetical protein A2Y34_13105 [Spirochaetes bacterium GWC1_27_15]
MQYNIGDIISFNVENSFFKSKGEIIRIFYIKDKTYIKIYSFFHRKNIYLKILPDGEFFILKKRNKKKLDIKKNEAVLYQLNDHYNPRKNLMNFIYKIILFLTILSLIIPHGLDFKNPFVSVEFHYKDFLNKNYNIYQLYEVITTRISYRYDMGEYWKTPEEAWSYKHGDCEEFSVICSDYLNYHKIENYIVGLNLKGSLIGHAAVFVKIKDVFYIIDLTKALEHQGIKKLQKAKTLKDAIKEYSTLPVNIFQVPKFSNDKIVIDTIY